MSSIVALVYYFVAPTNNVYIFWNDWIAYKFFLLPFTYAVLVWCGTLVEILLLFLTKHSVDSVFWRIHETTL